MLNKFYTLGRLVDKPRLSKTSNGRFAAQFCVAVDRDYKKEGQPEADFFDFTAFNKTAEYIIQHGEKGDIIGIEGRVQKGSYERDGEKVYTVNFLCDRVFYKQYKTSNNQPTVEEAVNQMRQGAQTNETFSNPFSTTAPIIDDSSLPF